MSNQTRHELLDQLEAKRDSMGLSMEKFANEVLGMSYQGYWRWLNKRFNPDLETLDKLKAIVQDGHSDEGGE